MLRSVVGTLLKAALALTAMGAMFWLLDTFPSGLFLVVLALTLIYLAVESVRKRMDKAR